MGLFDTLKSFGSKVGSGLNRAVGTIRHGVRRLGEISKPVGAALATGARFAVQNHQPIAMLMKAAGDASGNQTMQNVGNAAFAGSALLTARGVGQNYGLHRG
jgi:hypothetical protein